MRPWLHIRDEQLSEKWDNQLVAHRPLMHPRTICVSCTRGHRHWKKNAVSIFFQGQFAWTGTFPNMVILWCHFGANSAHGAHALLAPPQVILYNRLVYNYELSLIWEDKAYLECTEWVSWHPAATVGLYHSKDCLLFRLNSQIIIFSILQCLDFTPRSFFSPNSWGAQFFFHSLWPD